MERTIVKDNIVQAYKKLIQLCVYDENDKHILLCEIEHIVNKTKETEVLTALEDFSVDQNIPFFLGVDSGQGFWDNGVIQEFTYEILNKQFPSYDILLPDPSIYESTKWINLELLKDIDLALRIHQLQLSYFEDDNYDYLTIIHKIKDKEEIQNAMKSINYILLAYKIAVN